jgi:hypothetical protein
MFGSFSGVSLRSVSRYAVTDFTAFRNKESARVATSITRLVLLKLELVMHEMLPSHCWAALEADVSNATIQLARSRLFRTVSTSELSPVDSA